MPQSPMTTLGTAASMSMSVPIGARIAGGASSLRKSPIATESGAASNIAPNDVTTRADDQVARAELVQRRVPLVVPDEADPEVA